MHASLLVNCDCDASFCSGPSAVLYYRKEQTLGCHGDGSQSKTLLLTGRRKCDARLYVGVVLSFSVVEGEAFKR